MKRLSIYLSLLMMTCLASYAETIPLVTNIDSPTQILPSELISMKSKQMDIWYRKGRSGLVQLYSFVQGTKTEFVLAFEIRDNDQLLSVNRDEPLYVTFDDGSVLNLYCRDSVCVGNGVKNNTTFIGLLPIVSSSQYMVVCPAYNIQKKDLLRIVGGQVKSLSFYMQGQEYYIEIKNNRFSLVTGEECASLKSYVLGEKKTSQKITTPNLFGDTKLRRSSFGWNNTTMSLSVGMDHLYSRFDDSYYTRDMPVDLLSIDLTIKGFYFGMSGMSNRVEYGYPLNENYTISTLSFKLGPSFQYGNLCHKMTMTPYLGFLSSSCREKGPHRDDSIYKLLVGLRLMYQYKYFQIGANASNRLVGASIGYCL